MLRDAVARIAGKYGHGYFADRARAGGHTDELWREMSEHGFLTVHLDEELGGGGGGMTELAIVVEELAAQGCPLILMAVSAAICTGVIERFGSSEQKRRWLPRLVAGEKMVFAITEPDAGSNSHNVATTATRTADGFTLRGAKTFISGVDEAFAVLVVTRAGDGQGLSLFVVDTDTPGMVATPISMELTIPERQFALFLDDVEVPMDRLLGVDGQGLRQVFHGLNPERITGAAMAAGLGRYAIDKAATYACERSVWGTPIGAHQGVAHPLAEAKIQLEAARLMTQRACALYDDPDSDPRAVGEAANMAKFLAGDASLRCLDVAVQTHGGNGLTTEYGLADLWGLVRLGSIAPVSREMALNFVAQHSLGLPKSY